MIRLLYSGVCKSRLGTDEGCSFQHTSDIGSASYLPRPTIPHHGCAGRGHCPQQGPKPLAGYSYEGKASYTLTH